MVISIFGIGSVTNPETDMIIQIECVRIEVELKNVRIWKLQQQHFQVRL